MEFEMSNPPSPIKQLMCVLPPQDFKLLPVNICSFMADSGCPLNYMYPKFFDLDLTQGKHIYAEAILPKLNDGHIMSVLRNIAVTEWEAKRNVTYNHVFIK
jgi:5'-3' exonuclease